MTAKPILIVDDDRDLCDNLTDILHADGYEPFSALTCAEGLKLAYERKPLAAILDVKLPDGSGTGLLADLKKQNPDCQCIMVTAYPDLDSAVVALEEGAFHYVRKPVRTPELLILLEQVFDTIRLKDEKRRAEEAVRIRNKELEGINARLRMIVQSAKKFTLCSSLEGISSLLLKEFAQNMSAEGGSLYMREGDVLILTGSLGPGHAPATIDFPLKKGSVFEQAITKREPIFIKDIHQESDMASSGWDGYKEGSLLVFPIVDEGGEIFGIISLHSKVEPPFTRQDKEIGSILASYSCETIRATRALEALKKSEERFRIAAESASHLIYEWDLESGRFEWFGNVDEHLGYEQGEFPRTLAALKEIMHPEDRNRVMASIERHLETQEPFHEEYRVFGKDGDIRYWWNRGTVIMDNNGNPVRWIGVHTDITERRRLRDQLQHAQKMEAVGTLAGGIAHDFNNLLMGIQGRISLMLMGVESNNPNLEHFREIEEIVKRGADLTGQLLGFARGGKYEVKPTDLNDLINQSSEMFGRTKKEIRIHRKYERDIWAVEIDQGQIEQVLLNLFVNAWQAMPAGGDLYIRTKNVTLDEQYVKPFAVKPGHYVRISVTDTGIGMDEATSQRIFEPFFTTKEMGRGTGLGLASAYGIINNHNGIISVDSEKGMGSTFTVYLPASEQEVVKEEEFAEKILKGTETILFVDDEEMVSEVGQEILKTMGYEVLVAGNGQDALELYKKNMSNIDMVILDLIMPGMGGGETYDRLKEIDPDIKVLLSSGYSVNGHATEIMERGCDGFMQKPFNMQQISKGIREILDR